MHRKLVVGSVLQMSVANMNGMAVPLPTPALAPVFRRYPGINYRLRHPTPGIGTDPAFQPVVQGIHVTRDRNFVWLPYIPGLITFVPYNHNTIVTGWMSGCWLMLFTMAGIQYFGHLGTSLNAHHPDTLAVKNGWKLAVGTGVATLNRTFQPISASPSTLGAVSPNRHFYTIGISPSPVSQGAMNYAVDSKSRVPALSSLPLNY
jgi:hypothetical protein